jgi:replication factor C subunit 3/5
MHARAVAKREEESIRAPHRSRRALPLFSHSSQVAAGDMPHTLFYGPAGAGKTTLMKATLRELYGPGVERVKVETTPWKVATPSRTVDVELTTLASNYHVELTPADAGNMDR